MDWAELWLCIAFIGLVLITLLIEYKKHEKKSSKITKQQHRYHIHRKLNKLLNLIGNRIDKYTQTGNILEDDEPIEENMKPHLD
jgi:hypothetical protein